MHVVKGATILGQKNGSYWSTKWPHVASQYLKFKSRCDCVNCELFAAPQVDKRWPILR